METDEVKDEEEGATGGGLMVEVVAGSLLSMYEDRSSYESLNLAPLRLVGVAGMVEMTNCWLVLEEEAWSGALCVGRPLTWSALIEPLPIEFKGNTLEVFAMLCVVLGLSSATVNGLSGALMSL